MAFIDGTSTLLAEVADTLAEAAVLDGAVEDEAMGIGADIMLNGGTEAACLKVKSVEDIVRGANMSVAGIAVSEAIDATPTRVVSTMAFQSAGRAALAAFFSSRFFKISS